jgi:hypothetical protein
MVTACANHYLTHSDSNYSLGNGDAVRASVLAIGFAVVMIANAIVVPGWLLTVTAFALIAVFVSTMKGTRTNVRNY